MTTVSPEQTASILMAGADYIETHGWCQGSIRNQHGAVCAMGSLRLVVPPGPNGQVAPGENAAIAALAAYLELRPDPENPSPRAAEAGNLVTAWNDQAEDADQVITGMRHTAKYLTGGAQ